MTCMLLFWPFGLHNGPHCRPRLHNALVWLLQCYISGCSDGFYIGLHNRLL